MKRLLVIGSVVVLLLHFGGCQRHVDDESRAHASYDEHEHGEPEHEGHDDAEEAVVFDPKRGLRLAPETQSALGLRTVAIESRSIERTLRLPVHVVSTEPEVLASAFVSDEFAQRIRDLRLSGAEVLRLDRQAMSATQRLEIIFRLAPGPSRSVGDVVSIELIEARRNALVIPAAALLDSAEGAYVYVDLDGYFRRVAVQVGEKSPDFVEVLHGVSLNTRVVVAPVEQLWLTELRLTKGGGHSH